MLSCTVEENCFVNGNFFLNYRKKLDCPPHYHFSSKLNLYSLQYEERYHTIVLQGDLIIPCFYEKLTTFFEPNYNFSRHK